MPADDPTDQARGGENKSPSSSDNNDAVELIRAKIKNLYFEEPDAKQEAAEAEAARPRSKHQQFMHELSTSGKSLAQIQTEWHNYYVSLPDDEKHQVWQEFYANHKKVFKPADVHAATHQAPHHIENQLAKDPDLHKDAGDIKKHILKTVSTRARLGAKRRHQLKSLMFGLGMGTLVLVILMFGFFNERFIAPFITPSRTVSSTPIITDLTSTEKISSNPVVIIPKINIEIPVVYDEESIDDKAVQRALERGVLHYPTTSNPGEEGNAAFFGHSSSNIFNNGRYKYAFVLLRKLEIGDTFMIQKGGKRYVYKVFEKKVVKPTEVSVLNARDRPTATLITCDPPGSSANRLVVTGEQITPDPARNIASSAPARGASPETLPSEAPSLWHRLWGWLAS